MRTKVYLGPVSHPVLVDAVENSGGSLCSPEDAEVFLWTDPYQPKLLKSSLHGGVNWVSLPIAGVERYVAAGIVDDERVWTATKGVYAEGVSEHAMALLLACTRNLGRAVRRGTWASDPGWRLAGKQVVVLGTGGIGRALAPKLAAFGAVPVGVNRSGSHAEEFAHCVPVSGLVDALDDACALVVAVPRTPDTIGLVGEKELSALGPRGILINVARGDIVDCAALTDMLEDGRLGSSGLDVFDPEPVPTGHPLWENPNVIVTSHNANPFEKYPWEQHVEEYSRHLADNLVKYRRSRLLDGVIDITVGY